jgi:hypothetical protein
MHIKVNGQAVEIFSGARVRDAVRKSSPSAWALVRKKGKAVFDRYGHEVALDGELVGGEELTIRDRVPGESRS